jgi:hypothetical protein
LILAANLAKAFAKVIFDVQFAYLVSLLVTAFACSLRLRLRISDTRECLITCCLLHLARICRQTVPLSALVRLWFSCSTTHRFQDVDAPPGSDIDISIHVQALMDHITSCLSACTNLFHLHLHLFFVRQPWSLRSRCCKLTSFLRKGLLRLVSNPMSS